MNSWFPPLRARVVLIFSAALAVLGLVPVLYFVGLLAWQFAMLFQTRAWVPLPASLLFTDHSFAFVPQFPWAWLMTPDSLLPVHTGAMWVLGRLHVGLIFALAGLGIVALGVLGTLRQYATIRAQKQRSEDSRRRVRDYRRDEGTIAPLDERREPFISAPKKSRAAGGARGM